VCAAGACAHAPAAHELPVSARDLCTRGCRKFIELLGVIQDLSIHRRVSSARHRVVLIEGVAKKAVAHVHKRWSVKTLFPVSLFVYVVAEGWNKIS